MEHHSNFVPWQELAREKGAQFVVLPLTDDGRLDQTAALQIMDELGDKLKVLALTHVSNTLGTVNPVEKITAHLSRKSWRSRVLVVADIAQSAARIPLSSIALGVDALAFSGHKIYGPMGIGGLIVQRKSIGRVPTGFVWRRHDRPRRRIRDHLTPRIFRIVLPPELLM